MMRTFVLVVFFNVAFSNLFAQLGGIEIKKGSKGAYLEHIVAAKEGIYAIGRMYQVHPKHLAQYNGWDISKGLSIGQILEIPLSDTNFTQKSKTALPAYYVANAEDNLSTISSKFGKISLQKIKDWNSLKNDQITVGGKYVVGFLKQGAVPIPVAAGNVKTNQPDVETKKDEVAVPAQKNSEPVITKQETVPVVESLPVKQEVETVKEPVKPVIKAPSTPRILDADKGGYFKDYYADQYKSLPASQNETVNAGIFKTTSGWQDGKYYMLKDGVTPGTIIKVVNPSNRRLIYAKVLGEMNGISQNRGYDIRISEAAANVLGIKDAEKFIVTILY